MRFDPVDTVPPGESKVFTIPPGVPFLPAFADALKAGRFGRFDLFDAVIYVPTRRAARALQALLADEKASLLPRIVPLGEADMAEADFGEQDFESFEHAQILKPPIPPLERRLIFTQLIQTWAATLDRSLLKLAPDAPLLVPGSPADAVALAADLEQLMDALANENIHWDDLAQAVETDYSSYFELTLKFVRIAAERWPDILSERDASDPSLRRNALISAEAFRLARERPATPILAAGSTGSLPATAALLAAIVKLPNGAVILPGLDLDLDDESWNAIQGPDDGFGAGEIIHTHPQAVLRHLLAEHLRILRSEIRLLGEPDAAARARTHLVSEALRPAATTDRWSSDRHARETLAREGSHGLGLIEAADERQEALAVAIALRETLNIPGQSAALVTPDRGLAVRVKAELARWDVHVEDSAGSPLSESPVGVLARLAADAAAFDFEPKRLIALLAHPLTRLGLTRAELERGAGALEIGLWRGPAPAPGWNALRLAMKARRANGKSRMPRPEQRLRDEDWRLAETVIDRLALAFGAFSHEQLGEDALDLVAVAALHREAVEALTDHPEAEEDGNDMAIEGLAALFDDLFLTRTGGVAGRFVDYPAFFNALARQVPLRPEPMATHRRIKIYGLLEARLMHVDRVVLGGLDEAIWPPRTETDAFLNRPMRIRIGLTPPERRIGQSAHDFAQALGAREVVMTRAAKRCGSPTVPSRFLQRLKAFSGETVWSEVTRRGRRYLDFAHALDERPAAPPLPRPEPRPDPALIPRTLSVTAIETLIRDPYAVYARHILKLDALDPVAGTPDAAARGTLVHDILARFAMLHPEAVPKDALEILIALGVEGFAPLQEAFPHIHALWWPRFVRIAQDFLRWDAGRRIAPMRLHSERSASLPIVLKNGDTFTLRARADRIEQGADGFAIVDYKTGQPPSAQEVRTGFAPQLILEAALLMNGAFRDLPRAPMPDLLYLHLSGGRKALVPQPIEPDKKDTRSVESIVSEHMSRLEDLMTAYFTGQRGFRSKPFSKYAKRVSDYDHLARVKEWSHAAGEEE